MRRYSLFILDDDPQYIQAVELALSPAWQRAENFHRADAALMDIHLSTEASDFEGIDRIRSIRSHRPNLKIIATSGDLNRDTMEKALEAGCDLFLAKPLKPQQLLQILEKVEAYQQLNQLTSSHKGATWVGQSTISKDVKSKIAKLKGEDGPILIDGETGTGKEVVAQILNQQEGTRPFVRVNVAALSENLFESELYGYKKGAFTGATSDRKGLIEAADGGDLFLDEIETLSLEQQASLLRFLESGEFKPVGSNESSFSQTRVIAATNRPLKKMIEEKKFREDLYWRLAKHELKLPALRERTDDILELCHHFLAALDEEPKKVTDDGILELKKHPWPGNVRELKRVCEQLHLHSPLPLIRAEDVQKLLGQSTPIVSGKEPDYSLGLEKLINVYEAETIKSCLDKYQSIDEAVNVLKISRSSLYKKIKDHNIQWEKK